MFFFPQRVQPLPSRGVGLTSMSSRCLCSSGLRLHVQPLPSRGVGLTIMSSRCLCSSGMRLHVDTGKGAAPGVFLSTARPAASISRRWVDQHVVPLPLLPGEKKHDLKAVRPIFFTMCGSSDYHTSPLVLPLLTFALALEALGPFLCVNNVCGDHISFRRWEKHGAQSQRAPFPPITAPRGIQQGKSPGNPPRPINHAGTSTGQSTASSTVKHI